MHEKVGCFQQITAYDVSAGDELTGWAVVRDRPSAFTYLLFVRWRVKSDFDETW